MRENYDRFVKAERLDHLLTKLGIYVTAVVFPTLLINTWNSAINIKRNKNKIDIPYSRFYTHLR